MNKRVGAFRTYSRMWVTLVSLSGLVLALPAQAITPISQSFTAEDTISIGSIVSLKKNTSDVVVPASLSNVDNMYGVVITADSALLSLNGGGKNQVQVATSGIEQVLVSDLNGPIKQGDNITASPISGVGMRANSNIRTVGIAQGDLTATTKQTYKDSNGKEQSAIIGQIPMLVNISSYFKEPEKTIIPSVVQSVANALAGKAVSPVPIFVSAAIFLVMLIIVASMIYSMIRSSIISVGRNPLAQSAVYRDLVQLSMLVILILGVGMAAIYLTLTKVN